jgi:hypothetical protein
MASVKERAGQGCRNLLAEEGVKRGCGDIERGFQPGANRDAHYGPGTGGQLAREKRDVLVGAVLDKLRQRDAKQQRFQRPHERCPLRLIGWLQIEIDRQIRLRLGRLREERFVEEFRERLDHKQHRPGRVSRDLVAEMILSVIARFPRGQLGTLTDLLPPDDYPDLA